MKRKPNLTLNEIIELANSAEDSLEKLGTKSVCAIMFVDLAGSTNFKQQNPNEEQWLKRLAVFMLSLSKIINFHGRVIKYIGDEIMSIFEGSEAIINAEQTAERVLNFCDQFEKYDFDIKIAIDYGPVSLIDFENPFNEKSLFSKGDPQGLVVDRCARIASKCPVNVVLCSNHFYKNSRSKNRWKNCGSFKAKGIKSIVKVYQMDFQLMRRKAGAVNFSSMDMADCFNEIDRLKKVVEAYELKNEF